VRQERDERREESESDVTRDIGPDQTQYSGADEPEKTDTDRSEERLGQNAIINDLPSRFVTDWLARAAALAEAEPRALDVAMGRGRHAVSIAQAGYRTFGVDVRFDAVRDAVARGRAGGVLIRGWCADLTTVPLARDAFDLVVVTRYLERDLFPAIRAAVKPGGIVLYETFTVAQRLIGTGPASAEHLLEPGELAQQFAGFEILFGDEVTAPEAVARIAARRRRP
jgi:SAM-dependent methyltransferase